MLNALKHLSIRWTFALLLGGTVLFLVTVEIFGARTSSILHTRELMLYQRSEELSRAVDVADDQFHLQVWSWKNLLLRGLEPSAYHEYLSDFYDAERATILAMDSVLSFYGEDSVWAASSLEFLALHRDLGKSFRVAIRVYNDAETESHVLADRFISDADIEVRAALDAVVNDIHAFRSAEIEILERGSENAERFVVVATILLLLGSLALVVWMVDRRLGRPISTAIGIATRIAEGDLTTPVSSHGDDEVARLFGALENMRGSLVAAREAAALASVELARKERLAALGELTGTVAHELRNPLGALKTSISVIRLKAKIAGLDLDRSLDRTDRSVDRCDAIITELLDYTRAKGLQVRPMALDPWIAEVLAEQSVSERIAVHHNFRTNGSYVHFDPDDLRRAVINVVENASQAMTEDDVRADARAKPELRISTREISGRIEIEIADNGPGISERDLPQVLEPLFSTKSFGTGLGLPIVQRIMEAHGGGMNIESREGEGTRVVLWLSLGKDAEVRT